MAEAGTVIHLNVLNRRITRLRYASFAFLLFDLVYIFVLCLLLPEVLLLVYQSGSFTVLYVLATVAGLMGVTDRKPVVLYPVLVFCTILSLFTFVVLTSIGVQVVNCLGFQNRFHFPYPFISCPIQTNLRHGIFGIVFLAAFVFLEKMVEYQVIRSLVNNLNSAADPSNDQPSTSNVREVYIKSEKVRPKLSVVEEDGMDVEEQQAESEDDNQKKPKSAGSTQSRSKFGQKVVVPASPPPAYRASQNAPDTPTSSINELPLDNKSKKRLE